MEITTDHGYTITGTGWVIGPINATVSPLEERDMSRGTGWPCPPRYAVRSPEPFPRAKNVFYNFYNENLPNMITKKIATKMAGRRFPTLMCNLSVSRLRPMPKMSSPPTAVISVIMASVRKGLT